MLRAYFLLHALKAVRPPARSEIPPIARLGSTSGATRSESTLDGAFLYRSWSSCHLPSLAWAATLAINMRTTISNAYFVIMFISFLPCVAVLKQSPGLNISIARVDLPQFIGWTLSIVTKAFDREAGIVN